MEKGRQLVTRTKVRIRILDSNIELKKRKKRKMPVCRNSCRNRYRPNKSSVLRILKYGRPDFYNIYDSDWKIMMEVRL